MAGTRTPKVPLLEARRGKLSPSSVKRGATQAVSAVALFSCSCSTPHGIRRGRRGGISLSTAFIRYRDTSSGTSPKGSTV